MTPETLARYGKIFLHHHSTGSLYRKITELLHRRCARSDKIADCHGGSKRMPKVNFFDEHSQSSVEVM
jgi:hypothetical protein